MRVSRFAAPGVTKNNIRGRRATEFRRLRPRHGYCDDSSPMNRALLVLVIGMVLQATIVRAAPRAPVGTLPQGEVLTNLRSPTGRTVYLVLRPHKQEQALRERTEAMARSVGAKLLLRAAGPLWIAVLETDKQGLDVHRLGPDLLLTPSEPTALQKTNASGVLLRSGRKELDLDLEIMAQARQAMRDRSDTPPALVALAQGAAARLLLHYYAAGEDLRVLLFGRRYLALLVAHPDAALLKQVLEAAEPVLDPTEEAEAAGPAPPAAPGAPVLQAAEEALAAAEKIALAARAPVPKTTPKGKTTP